MKVFQHSEWLHKLLLDQKNYPQNETFPPSFLDKNKPDHYNLVNTKNYSIAKIINTNNEKSNKKIKVNWTNNKLVKQRIFKNKGR